MDDVNCKDREDEKGIYVAGLTKREREIKTIRRRKHGK
jgi:hypothetical protein